MKSITELAAESNDRRNRMLSLARRASAALAKAGEQRATSKMPGFIARAAAPYHYAEVWTSGAFGNPAHGALVARYADVLEAAGFEVKRISWSGTGVLKALHVLPKEQA